MNKTPTTKVKEAMCNCKSLHHRMPVIYWALMLMAVVALVHCLPAWSADDSAWVTIEAEGTGAVGKLNYYQAREYAVEDALSKAFKSVLMTLLPPDIGAGKLQEAWRVVNPGRNEYILKYGITTESSDADTERVMVKATFAAGLLADKLHAMGYNAVLNKQQGKEVVLTVDDVRSYEEFEVLSEFLKRDVPCIRQVVPSCFSGNTVSFRLTLQGKVGCVMAKEGPFSVEEITDNAITGIFHHTK